MQSSSSLEPGIIPAFRLFTAIRLTVMLVIFAVSLAVNQWSTTQTVMLAISLGDVLLLLAFLSWSRLQGVFKSWYLPVAIILATVGPILGQYVAIRISIDNLDRSMFVAAPWQSVLVLFIPLFIISWQYAMREVVLFSVVTLFLDGIPIFILRGMVPQESVIFPIIGIVFVRTFSFLLVGYMAVNLMKTQRGLRASLTDANTRLARYTGTLEQLTVSRERNRLARELHDVLAHTLSGLAVELEAVKTIWDIHPEQAAEMLDHSLQSTRAGLTETRRALQALRASPLEDLGLALAVRGLAETAAARTGMVMEANIAENLPDYPPEVEQTAYRVAEEALRNASDHAGARMLRIELSGGPGSLELIVEDDGRGFDPQKVDPLVQFGLVGMRERAEAVGGRLQIETRVSGGTQVRLAYGEAK